MVVKFLKLIKIYYLSVFIVIGAFCVTTALCQQINYAERFTKQNGFLQISSSINNKKKCSDNSIVINTTILVKNLTEKPIVICKECITSGAVFVSKDIDSLHKEKFVYDLDSFGYSAKIKEVNFLPNQLPFATILPQQTFSFNVPTLLYSFDRKTILPNGKYVFVQVLETWSDSSPLFYELEKKWAKEGLVFWNKSILTNPTILNLGKLKHSKCS